MKDKKKNLMLIDDCFEAIEKVHEYFGYVEDWVKIPLDDARGLFWFVNQIQGFVRFAETKEKLLLGDGEYYENQIYTQRFLPRYVYRVEKHTMICVDTRTDGNKFLQIFDNDKEVTEDMLK